MEKPLHILFVEKDHSDLLHVLNLLEKAGLMTEMEVVSSADEAMTKLKALRFDAVLLDPGLPFNHTLDVLRTAKAINSEMPVLSLELTKGKHAVLDLIKSGDSESLLRGLITTQEISKLVNRALIFDGQMADATSNLLELKESEQHYRLIIDKAPDGIISYNSQGRIIDWNPQAEIIFGWPKEECFDHSFKDKVLSPEEWNSFEHSLSNFVNAGFAPWINRKVEVWGQRRDGEVFPLEMVTLPIKRNGTQIFLAFIKDNSLLRKQQETMESMLSELQDATHELQRSNKELEQFAYIASHDLQEPLRMITSYTQLLKIRNRDRLDKDGQDFINYIINGANRMKVLISDLLEYSRVGRQRDSFVPVDFVPAIENAIENLHEAITESKASIIVDYAALPRLYADPSQIQRLFQNLISNGLKFRGTEDPVIKISAQEEVNYWRFSVSDNGIGIPEDQLGRIFVIFQRLHSSSDYPGTGIGLAVSKKIVECHGGDIWVESKVGKGTTFIFRISKLLNPEKEKQQAEKSLSAMVRRRYYFPTKGY